MIFLLTFREFEMVDDFDDWTIDWTDDCELIDGAYISKNTIRDLKELHGLTDDDIINMIQDARKDLECGDEPI